MGKFSDHLAELGRQRGPTEDPFEAQAAILRGVLVDYLIAQEARDTELIALQRGFWSNNILSSGMWRLDANLCAHPRFNVPFAWLYVSDPDGIGPFYLINADDDSLATEAAAGPVAGVGRWKVGAGAYGSSVPLSGSELTVYVPNGSVGAGICVAAFVK